MTKSRSRLGFEPSIAQSGSNCPGGGSREGAVHSTAEVPDSDVTELMELLGKSVADVMVTQPKVTDADATIGQARALLGNDHVHMVLLLNPKGELRGTIIPGDIPEDADASALARDFSRLRGRTVSADVGALDVLRNLLSRSARRLAVVDEHRMLLGLVCLKRSGTGFCSDEGVTNRLRERLDRRSCDLPPAR